jgi:transposase
MGVNKRRDMKMAPRRHSLEFKKQVVDEVISGRENMAQVCRKHGLSTSVVFDWKKKFGMGQLSATPGHREHIQQKAYEARIAELERMIGRLAMENELLKKAEAWIKEQRKRDSLVITAKNLAAYKEDVKS